MIRAALALALAGCQAKIVDLGRDGAVDSVMFQDAAGCVCRITPCRVTGDCSLIGGVCGADLYCVGSFGSCTSDAECQATATGSVCTQSASSTAACP